MRKQNVMSLSVKCSACGQEMTTAAWQQHRCQAKASDLAVYLAAVLKPRVRPEYANPRWLAGFPLDSVVGRDCKRVIDQAATLLKTTESAAPDLNFRATVIGHVIKTCEIFAFG